MLQKNIQMKKNTKKKKIIIKIKNIHIERLLIMIKIHSKLICKVMTIKENMELII